MVNPEIENYVESQNYDSYVAPMNDNKYTVTDIKYWTDPPMDTPLPSTIGSIPWIGYPVSREPLLRKAALAFLLAVLEEYDCKRTDTNDEDYEPTPLAKAMKELEDVLGT